MQKLKAFNPDGDGRCVFQRSLLYAAWIVQAPSHFGVSLGYFGIPRLTTDVFKIEQSWAISQQGRQWICLVFSAWSKTLCRLSLNSQDAAGYGFDPNLWGEGLMQCEDCPNRQTREMEPTVFVSRVVIATSQGFRFQFRSLSGGPNIRRLEKACSPPARWGSLDFIRAASSSSAFFSFSSSSLEAPDVR